MIDRLNALGITTDTLLVTGAALLVLLLVIAIILLVQNAHFRRRTREMEYRIDRFMQGTSGGNIEEDIAAMFDENDQIRDTLAKQKAQISNIYFRLRSTIQKVGVVKYDAFSQMGGALSSAVALLDENDNGIVINSVHSVEGNYSYTKIVRNGRSDIELGAEEAEALDMAMKNFHRIDGEEPAGKNKTAGRKG